MSNSIALQNLYSMKLMDSFLLWRKQLVTVSEIESDPILDHSQPMSPDCPEWTELKSKMLPSDELWTFRSPDTEWDRHMGWQGIILVRNGVVIDAYITAQN